MEIAGILRESETRIYGQKNGKKCIFISVGMKFMGK
jgi:hypothetical protein